MNRRAWAVAAGLTALALLIYWPVARYGFVSYDDGKYVAQNPMVLRGLSWAGACWAFTTGHASNWHPLTWLSHMLDVQLFGAGPGPQHEINVVLHALNAVLLFAVLRRATGALWRPALVAALFVAHPLHVESVAWIAERKDVLSTAFALLAVLAYLGVQRRMWLVSALFAASLLAKQTWVTLPALLLLVDAWPLRRELRIREKLPLFALSAVAALATLLAQRGGGAVSAMDALPFPARVGNAILSYALYLWKAIWPAHLAVFYPHPAKQPGGLAALPVLASAVLLVLVSALVLWQRERRPALFFGWAWYVIALLPVIGLVQIGLQGMADRYTYVPLVGPFAALAWSLPDFAGARRAAAVALAAVTLCALSAVARVQVGTWRDSTTLFAHAIDAVPGNWLAWQNLGVAQADAGDDAAALRSYETALAIRGPEAKLLAGIGTSQLNLGNFALASAALEESVRLDGREAQPWNNLGIALAKQGRAAGAVEAFAAATRAEPSNAAAWRNLALALSRVGRYPDAAQAMAQAQRAGEAAP